MASQVSTGSPKMNRKQTPSIKQNEDRQDDNQTPRNTFKAADSSSATPVLPNTSSSAKIAAKEAEEDPVINILAQLRVNDSRKPSQAQIKQQDHLDRVMAGLKDQHRILKKQQMDLKDDSDTASFKDQDRSSGSELFTPATENFEVEVHDTEGKKTVHDTVEMARIKQQLEAAKSVINRQEMELAESRTLRHTMEQAIGPASEADFPLHIETAPGPANLGHSAFNASARPFTSRTEPTWQAIEDCKNDFATALANSSMHRGRNWTFGHAPALNAPSQGYQGFPYVQHREARANSLGYGPNYAAPPTSPVEMNAHQNRTFSSGSSNVSYSIEDRFLAGAGSGAPFSGHRRPANQLRSNSTISDPLSPITPINPYMQPTIPYSQNLVDTNALAAGGGAIQYSCLEHGFGGQTSPVTGQFPAAAGQAFPGDISMAIRPPPGLTPPNYVVPAEPMNYRRLLDKSVSCDWKYIVDKIVCNNDQQASIFLQQKLKVGTAEQKYEIVESIVNQAYPLMINRFGNFLVQRCFEHGTPEQVIAIANAIHGNVISLSMDPFGCHVIQKAFDSVPEDHKADMVRELLRRIPDTVIHRYACHVWQKLFELRWSGEPPQIMVKVNEALQGMWHEVALGETGSLVVQNIFENCVEEEKRPAIEEVISNIDLIAHGQFGNWCIQHLCEHGSPPDKRRVIDHILQNSYNYSIDQFASKVVEKCLKIGGQEFLERYLGVITTARPDRPRIPLIDIAGDQYGNYLIQWILMNTHQHQREQVAIHIRKHMVSLRGSKFGSRVAMLCSNPASVTRPGAASALVNPYGAPAQQRMGGRFR